jgi:ABC-type glucose/galactose transport system permease subunit
MKLLKVLLTLIPFLWTIGAIPFANRARPLVFGLPLLMVWIIAGTLVAFGCLMALYKIDTSHKKN